MSVGDASTHLPEANAPAERWASAEVDSPLGVLRLAATERGLVKIAFPGGSRSDFNAWLARHVGESERVGSLPVLDEAIRQIGAYFEGGLREFEVPLDVRGGTAFQVRVWRTLAEIPYGVTWTYGQLAQRVGRPAATRAVGSANGANPLPLLLPCHRVIAAGGKLGGFGGGLDAKRRLLALESSARPLLSSD